MMEYTADEIIKRLGMQPHREGGWYRFVWKNEQTVAEGALGDRYKGERSVRGGDVRKHLCERIGVV